MDLFILLAKYRIFHAKTNNGNPLIQVFVRTVKQRFVVEKYKAVIKDNIADREWALYSHFKKEKKENKMDVSLRFVDS